MNDTKLGSNRVVVVTGMSGAGKSTALHALEDLGFFCIDNLPPAVIEHAVSACEEDDVLEIALGLHVHVRSFLDDAAEAITRLGREMRRTPSPPAVEALVSESAGPLEEAKPDGVTARTEDQPRNLFILFLDASDDVLVRRFSETRRPHPLAPDEDGAEGAPSSGASPVAKGIRTERQRLAPLRAMASVVLDTSHLTVHQLRKRVFAILGPEERTQLETRVVSFGFKYGIPSDANVVLDVRFLDNPYFVPELRPMSGLDAPVRDFVLGSSDALCFIERAEELLAFSLPRYESEGRTYLTIAVGCTGGQHRSVAIAEELAARLRQRTRMPIGSAHRDVGRDQGGRT